VDTSGDDTALFLPLLVLLPGELGEAPLVGHEHFLAAREFVLSTTESLDGLLGLVLLQKMRESLYKC
jgi:hypothetical protein